MTASIKGSAEEPAKKRRTVLNSLTVTTMDGQTLYCELMGEASTRTSSCHVVSVMFMERTLHGTVSGVACFFFTSLGSFGLIRRLL